MCNQITQLTNADTPVALHKRPRSNRCARAWLSACALAHEFVCVCVCVHPDEENVVS